MNTLLMGLLASSLIGGSLRSDHMRPDIRHWSEDIYNSAPQFEDFEDFLSDLELSGDMNKLNRDQEKRLQDLKALESIDLSKESAGRGYILGKQILDVSFKISSYQRMMAEREAYFKSKEWRLKNLQLRETIAKQPDIESHSLKSVGFARNLVNSFAFDPDYNQYLLIRLLARTQNSNLFLFYEQFKKRFPNSSYMPYVHHVVAEYYFQKKDYDKSEALLKSIMDNKDSKIRPYSTYKVAWTYIARNASENNPIKSTENLAHAARLLRQSIELMEDWDFYKPLFPLKEEAAKDLACLLAEMRAPKDDVKTYFKQHKLVEAYQIYLNYLAVDALRSLDTKLAEATFAEYLPLVQESRYLPQYLMSQIELFIQNRSFDKVLEAYKNIRNLLQEPHPWHKEWHEDTELMAMIQRQLAQHLVFTASGLQQEAEKLTEQPSTPKAQGSTYDSAKLLLVSKGYYDLFMDWFPQSDAQDDASYNYALLVFQNGDVEQAIHLLSAIASNSKSSHQRDAAYSTVIAAVNWDASKILPKLPAPGKAKSPVPLTASKSLLIEKIDYFHKNWPDDETNVPALYTAAQTLFDFGHYEDSMKRFDQLIKIAPKTEQGESALNTLLSYYVESSRWDDLISICKEYLSNKKVASSGHRKLIRQTLDYAKSQKPGGAS